MNWAIAIISGIVSGLLASALTLFGDRYLFKLSTKEKYREKIIDKRLEAYRDKLRNWLAEFSLYSSINVLRYVWNSVVETQSEAGPIEKSIKSRIRLVDILEYIRKELGLELAEPRELEKIFGRKREE